MCGIVGIYNFKTNKEVLHHDIDAMSSVIPYRGPDGKGEYFDSSLGLGHRRLTIIDTHSRSDQPMSSDDGNNVICYNGEVYNYVELKQELKQLGYEFSTGSDTEVILQAFRHWGIGSLAKFNGMFAFAMWDKTKNQLVIARDRMGIKPLYYAETEAGIVFASELKSLLVHLEQASEANTDLIDSYMSLGYCTGEDTLFQGIKKLAPGDYLQIDKHGVKKTQYWDINFNQHHDRGEEYYVEKAATLFRDAVKLQLRSDVPLGVFLSGGIDSSAVVAMMRDQGVKAIKTFSVAWDHAAFGKSFNETEYARQVADMFSTDHHEFIMTPELFQNFLPQYIRHMDEPVCEAAAISLYYLAKKTKEHVTVVLSGEGSDEVFGGYPIYKYMQIVDGYKSIPAIVRNAVLNPILNTLGGKWKKYTHLSGLSLEQSYFGVSFQEDKYKSLLYTDDFSKIANQNNVAKVMAPYYERTEGQHLQSRMQYLDYKTWLADDLLIKADRMSMAASLELRVPFLDHRLVEFAASMPAKYRIKKGCEKYIIKKSMERYLPNSILYRKKMGFPTPLSMMFKGDLYPFVVDTLDSKQAHSRNYFKPESIRLLIEQHRNEQYDHHKILWQLLVLELWHREFVDSAKESQ